RCSRGRERAISPSRRRLRINRYIFGSRGAERTDERHGFEQGLCKPQQSAPKRLAGGGRLPGSAPAGEFAHDQTQIKRDDPAKVACVEPGKSPQRGPSQPSAVKHVRKAPLDLLAPHLEQSFT